MSLFKHSAVYTDVRADTVYIATGDQVRPLFGSDDNRTGLWRSPRFITRQHPGYAWARVNGRMDSPVVLRLYGDGVLIYTTPSITNRDPVRLPAVRTPSWEIEVECDGRGTMLLLASTLEEALQDG